MLIQHSYKQKRGNCKVAAIADDEEQGVGGGVLADEAVAKLGWLGFGVWGLGFEV